MTHHDFERHALDTLERQKAEVVHQLRRIADDIERTEIVPNSEHKIAMEIMTKVLWGLANLRMDGLIQQVADINTARNFPDQVLTSSTNDGTV